MNLTTEKPILFNTEMVKAILAGQKTSTRRIIKNLSIKDCEATLKNGKKYKRYTLTDVDRYGNESEDFWFDGPIEDIAHDKDIIAYAPYKVGDILYVRETWSTQYDGIHDNNGYGIYVYKADGTILDNSEMISSSKWHPSIHMPKKAARLFLKVTDVKVQQIQDITEDAAKAEGATPQIWYQPYGTKTEGEQRYIGDIVHQKINYVTGFAHIWDKTINKKEYAFQSNPWVWVIEFEKVKK